MNTDALRFELSERTEGDDISPSRVPLGLLQQFAKEVGDFLAGSSNEIDAKTMNVSIETGSLALVSPALPAGLGIWSDLSRLQKGEGLNGIDPGRSKVVAKWQAASRKHINRVHAIRSEKGSAWLTIDVRSRFVVAPAESWHRVERYILGKVRDMGGKAPNLHLELQDGSVMLVAATREQIAQEDSNHVYHDVMLRVQADRHVITGKLSNLRLINFMKYAPRFDESEFSELTRKGNTAWAGIDDPVAWVRDQRGG